MTGEIVFSSEPVDALADALATASAGLLEILTALESKLAVVAWDGQSEEAYRLAQSQWSAVMEEMTSMLGYARQGATTARGALVEAEERVAALWVKG